MGDSEYAALGAAGDYATTRYHIGTFHSRRRIRDLFCKSYWATCVRGDHTVGPLPRGLAKLEARRMEMDECQTE